MPLKPPRTWILVADSARARVVAWVGHDEPLHQVEGFDMRFHHEQAHDMMSERPGRTHETHGATRHAIEPRMDPVRQAEHRFAESVARALDDRLARKEFDRFVLVAGPTMLGDLRPAFSTALHSVIHGTIDKNLTHLTNTQLKDHLLAAELM
jgi:protein required for attachment to host cells